MATTLRPVWSEYDFGPDGWKTLHDLARQRGRSAKDQARAMLQYALAQARAGVDVELSQERLESLLAEAPAA